MTPYHWDDRRGGVDDTGELLFCNGAVFDGAAFLAPEQRIRVRGTTIVEIGPDLAAGPAEIVDLAGGTVLPGFIDAHAHPVFAGNQLRHCDLRAGSTIAEYVRIVAEYAGSHPDESWITGGGWAMEAFPGGLPRREALDAVVADRPIFLPNQDGHGAWVNSTALAMAGIDRDTPDPRDGRIERDPDGTPTGMLQEGAADLVSRLLPELSDEDWYQALLLAQDYLFSYGITGWQDAIVGGYAEAADPLPTYLRAAGDGSLVANVIGALWWDRSRGLDQVDELLHRRATGQLGRFHANAVKMMLDGVAETHTASMLSPYLDHDGCASTNLGLDFIDPDELPSFVSSLDRQDFQVHFHALGDRAIRNALDSIASARAANHRDNDSGPRHHLAHLQVVHPDDLDRFAGLSATANIQPLWAVHDQQMDDLTIPFLGAERASWQYPFRALQDGGAAMCAGSDWPVSSPDPLAGAHVAVNRTAPGKPSDPTFLADQRIDLTSILAAYTSGSAKVNGLDATTGAIRPGMDADFAVVDADLAHIDRGDIGSSEVVSTWVRGVPVYERA